MGDKQEKYAEAKKLLEVITNELKDPTLTPDQREELELHAARLSGVLLRPWLPVLWTPRLIMAAILVLGLWQATIGNHAALLFWLLLPFFSPRIVGEVAYFAGRYARVWKN